MTAPRGPALHRALRAAQLAHEAAGVAPSVARVGDDEQRDLDLIVQAPGDIGAAHGALVAPSASGADGTPVERAGQRPVARDECVRHLGGQRAQALLAPDELRWTGGDAELHAHGQPRDVEQENGWQEG